MDLRSSGPLTRAKRKLTNSPLNTPGSGRVSKRKKNMKKNDNDSDALDESVQSLSLDDTISSCKSEDSSSDFQNRASTSNLNDDCSICLQTPLHPVKLPCNHIFCFLCIKGVVHHSSPACALCRTPVPRDYIVNPEVIEEVKYEGDVYSWYYEGRRGGWWEYDERTSKQLEENHTSGTATLEVLIAGYLYIIDFNAMVQMRKSATHIQRRIKRDINVADHKGVAGLKAKKKSPTRTTV